MFVDQVQCVDQLLPIQLDEASVEHVDENRSSESEDSEFEDLKSHNKDCKPFRDNKEGLDCEVKPRSVRPRKILNDSEIKRRVKKTISQRQKQERRQRLRKGESGVVTKARKENRIAIKEGIADE